MEISDPLICSLQLSHETRYELFETHRRSNRAGYVQSRIARDRHDRNRKSSTRVAEISVKNILKKNIMKTWDAVGDRRNGPNLINTPAVVEARRKRSAIDRVMSTN